MEKLKVLIIEDSAFMRKMITEILLSDERIHMIETARNGKEGLKKIKTFSPDVITLDIEMPVLDGIDTLKVIMEETPLPVVMLSSLTSRGATQTIEAMSVGAIDFIAKPSGSISLDINDIKEEIIDKVIMAAHSNTTRKKKPITDPVKTMPKQQAHTKSLVAIGTSTGGPRALQEVLRHLPKDFNAPILIVQHMPPNFTKSLANRLNTLSEIEVKEATHGEIIRKGVAYIAPGDFHMRVRKTGMALTIELTKSPLVNGHRPAVDTLFLSIAELERLNKIAVILTGMGRDGSLGLTEIKKRDKGAIILSESEDSSIVYGMPAAAAETGYVNQVLNLYKMGEAINNLVSRPRRV